MTENTSSNSELDMIKSVHDDGCATINGRTYTFGTFTHKKRLRVFAFSSSLGAEVSTGSFAFLASPEFQAINDLICENTLFDGMQISKLPEHWEKYPDDFIKFIMIAMGAISYPFARGVV